MDSVIMAILGFMFALGSGFILFVLKRIFDSLDALHFKIDTATKDHEVRIIKLEERTRGYNGSEVAQARSR